MFPFDYREPNMEPLCTSNQRGSEIQKGTLDEILKVKKGNPSRSLRTRIRSCSTKAIMGHGRKSFCVQTLADAPLTTEDGH